MPSPHRYVYAFEDDLAQAGVANPKSLLGGKGHGLCRMTSLGVPVPPGFVITTEACRAFQAAGTMPDGLEAQVDDALAALEASMGKRLGDADAPLLVSVRSGASVSMPGMMDTVLNLGLTDAAVEGLAKSSGDRRFAFDAYRRFIEMYSDVVLGVPRDGAERLLADAKQALHNPMMADHELSAEQMESIVKGAKAHVKEQAGAFPQDAREQLWGAIRAVFESWNNVRAVRYRRMQNISDDLGTGVTVQAMVFGNMGDDSGSGVAFTRNPSTGQNLLYGEYLPNAQGEDVVAGIRTPRPLSKRAAAPGQEALTLEAADPTAFATVSKLAADLETKFRDLQDIEFTIEKSRVFILQTRSGKRTAQAAVKIAKEMVEEGLLSQSEALMKIEASSLDQLLHARLPEPEVLKARGTVPIATGLPASPGAAMGTIVLDADSAEAAAKEGRTVILVRRETSPEDIHGMKAAAGVVTATGGMTSHAAVVARGLGKCCVAGVGNMSVDYESQKVTVRTETGPIVLSVGDTLSLDGRHGAIYSGEIAVEAAATVPEFETIMAWADEERRLGVRANADTPSAARTARSYGAEGIGLCRTEHMFFADDRLRAVRAMVLAETEAKRDEWLAKIRPMQQSDFEAIFEAMDGLPVTVRLLDWPLHEFMPKEDAEFEEVATLLGESAADVKRRAEAQSEINPMLGHRGVRVGITQPSIYRMQIRAILDATIQARGRGVKVLPEIMVPVVALGAEVKVIRALVDEIAKELAVDEFLVGTMIELPRACLTAEELAEHADFFSFGTNDLTQTTFGLSRDDSGRFLPRYMDADLNLLKNDPFASLDVKGVGALIRIAVERGTAARPGLKLGICGEHGGDPESIEFANAIGLSYVSCSPPRLPIARLAAAQAAIRARSDS